MVSNNGVNLLNIGIDCNVQKPKSWMACIISGETRGIFWIFAWYVGFALTLSLVLQLKRFQNHALVTFSQTKIWNIWVYNGWSISFKNHFSSISYICNKLRCSGKQYYLLSSTRSTHSDYPILFTALPTLIIFIRGLFNQSGYYEKLCGIIRVGSSRGRQKVLS